MSSSSGALAAALLLCAAGPGAAASAVPVAAFDDPAGDATGPGTYVPPGDTEFTEGDFDLRRFAVLADGEDVLFEVTLGAAFRRPAVANRTNSAPLELWNGIYLQNVDIYVDTDPASAAGFTACIPGRRVAFEPGRTWKAAVVLTPQPGPARSVAAEALGEAARHVVFATDLQTRGRTVIARVPAAALGGPPRREWGYSVHVSGANWERSLALVDRLRRTAEVDAFTMPVRTLRGAWAFGGAPPGNAHPRVVDVLLPPGADQQAVLGSFDEASGFFARVPFVYAVPPPPVAAAPAPPPAATAGTAPPPGAGAPASAADGLTVADVSGEMVSVRGPVAGVRAFQIGRVLAADGSTAARIVVVQLVPGGLVASAVEGRDRIARGAAVRFDAQAP